MSRTAGLGADLRALTAALDGDVQSFYDDLEFSFRPRFYPIVQHLLGSGPTRINDLAVAIGVSQPAASQTIAQMTKAGLVAASPGSDGRERRIALTAQGTAVVERLMPLWRAVDGAARELNAELPMPLSELIAATFHALHRESFEHRIRRNLEDD